MIWMWICRRLKTNYKEHFNRIGHIMLRGTSTSRRETSLMISTSCTVLYFCKIPCNEGTTFRLNSVCQRSQSAEHIVRTVFRLDSSNTVCFLIQNPVFDRIVRYNRNHYDSSLCLEFERTLFFLLFLTMLKVGIISGGSSTVQIKAEIVQRRTAKAVRTEHVVCNSETRIWAQRMSEQDASETGVKAAREPDLVPEHLSSSSESSSSPLRS